MKAKTLSGWWGPILILALALAACQPGEPEIVAPDEGGAIEAETQPPVSATEPPAPAVSAALPADPVKVDFAAADGQALTGYYYPASATPAPLVVFMHWINGDMSDWYEIAPWLQNRGLANPFPNGGNLKWWDPAWFPKVPADRSYGVFIFSFRGCLPMSQRGCSGISEAQWLLDAQAAMEKAATLEGVDPARIAAIGSSIGADGAIDGCLWLAQQRPGACRGALSLSPGGYLTVSYQNAVQSLKDADPTAAAWCLADGTEIGICRTAQSVGLAGFQAHEIPGGQHGNMLLRPDLIPLPMQLILDFLAQTLD